MITSLLLQIPKTAAEQDLLTVFTPFGEVESVNILKSKGLHAGTPPGLGGGLGFGVAEGVHVECRIDFL